MTGKLIIQNDKPVTASGILSAILEFDSNIKGQGMLRLIWTDSYGRTVSDEAAAVPVEGGRLEIKLPLKRTIAMLNFLEAVLTIGEAVIAAPREEFIVTPDAHKLDDYHIIMYNHYKPHQQEALRRLGINAGQLQPKDKNDVAESDKGRIWYQYNYRFYCDQIAVPYYAAYHTPALNPKHKLLGEAKELYRQDRTKKDAFIRKPSFHDEEATGQALDRIIKTVERQMRFKPLMYTTDECGVADLVSAWDFDFDPRALAAMRKWLLEQYGSLEAINREWETSFKSIDEVVPFTTDEMMARGCSNLSPWADHRHFMNKAFTDSVAKGTEAAHSVDPEARSGIVGCQMPSAFGGYDYWLLSKAIDIIEPYNIGNNREIWRSFAPDKPAFTTFFRYGGFEVWRLWHQALHGDRGIIIYDENHSYLDEEGNPTELGANLTPYYRELTSGIVRQLAHGRPDTSPVAVHYSQASITAHWMFDVGHMGENWINRGSAVERFDSEFLRLRESTVKLLEDNLTGYDFVSYEQLENGEFVTMDKKLLILPQSVAMSPAEAEGVRKFAEKGGVVLADYRTALMDGHCKQQDKGQLDDLFGIDRSSFVPSPGKPGLTPISSLPQEYEWARPLISLGSTGKVPAAEPGIKPAGDSIALYSDNAGIPAVIVNNYGEGKAIYLNLHITDYHRWRLKKDEGLAVRSLISTVCSIAGINSTCPVTDQEGSTPSGIELFTWNYGSMKIISFHRNYQNRVSELGPPEYQDQSSLEADMTLTAALDDVYEVYETRTGKYLGAMKEIRFDMSKWEPNMFTLLKKPVTGLEIKAPASAKKAEMFKAAISLLSVAPGDMHVFRATVKDPTGNEMEMLTSNLAAPGGKVIWEFPFAQSDQAGVYTLAVKDVATGLSTELKVNLE